MSELLEKDGIVIEVIHVADVRRLLRSGYTPVEVPKETKPKSSTPKTSAKGGDE